jgi:hypothetical protein
MKTSMCLALIILTILPASAQKAASTSCTASVDAAAALAHDYAAGVDGLLRQAHSRLREISERTEAGDLSADQSRKLKLAATEDMISRLDTISAVYVVRLDATNSRCFDHPFVAGNAPTTAPASHGSSHIPGTVSVEELKRDAATTASTPHADGAAR